MVVSFMVAVPFSLSLLMLAAHPRRSTRSHESSGMWSRPGAVRYCYGSLSPDERATGRSVDRFLTAAGAQGRVYPVSEIDRRFESSLTTRTIRPGSSPGPLAKPSFRRLRARAVL